MMGELGIYRAAQLRRMRRAEQREFRREILPYFPRKNCCQIRIFRLAARTAFRHIVAARYCDLRSAMPPPFLGVSSLNLAAPRSGHFFCPGLLRPGVRRALRSWASKSDIASRAPGQRTKSLGAKCDDFENYSAASGRPPRRVRSASGIAGEFGQRVAQPLLHRVEGRPPRHAVFFQIQAAVDLDLQRMAVRGAAAIQRGGIAAGIRRIARNAETRAGKGVFGPCASAAAAPRRHSGRPARYRAPPAPTAWNGNRSRSPRRNAPWFPPPAPPGRA